LSQKPTTSETYLGLGNAVTVDEQADEDEEPRDGCGHTLDMYQTVVPYHINHDDRNKSGPRNI
jgi:hypothetical protein